MKKLINMTLLLILLPLITILIIKPLIKQQNQFQLEKNMTVRVKRIEKNKIETIPLEKYLVGVIGGEMPISYNIEALKAQAVAARTYTIKKIETNKNNEYDIVDTTSDQVYLDDEQLKTSWQEKYIEYKAKIETAVKETRGEYITYEGKAIKAFFFSTSSGKTENCKDVFGENLPYLISVSSTWDENSPAYLTTLELTKEDFYKKLELEYKDELNIEIERNETNSIKTITINGTTLKGTDFRYKLNLKSTNIDIKEENNIIITSKGFGHGVGMSQYGAEELASIGYKYDQIIKYYYQGTEIKKI